MPGVQPPADLFDDTTTFAERWQQGERPAVGEDKPKLATKDFTAAKASVWDPTANVLAVLTRPMTAEDICRFTGLMPEQAGAALCKLQGEGRVRRCGSGMWERIVVAPT